MRIGIQDFLILTHRLCGWLRELEPDHRDETLDHEWLPFSIYSDSSYHMTEMGKCQAFADTTVKVYFVSVATAKDFRRLFWALMLYGVLTSRWVRCGGKGHKKPKPK